MYNLSNTYFDSAHGGEHLLTTKSDISICIEGGGHGYREDYTIDSQTITSCFIHYRSKVRKIDGEKITCIPDLHDQIIKKLSLDKHND